MRFRLLRRRLTVSSPRMAVRSALPWPFRWAMLAVVFGFCAAIALWAFEFGKVIAGVDGSSERQTIRLGVELEKAQKERDEAQAIANTSQTLITAGRAAQEELIARNKVLAQEILNLRDELGFFEKLIPMSGVESIAVRGLQVEVGDDGRLKWRVLLIQPRKTTTEFKGSLEFRLTGMLRGKPWQMSDPEGEVDIRFTQFGRFQGFVELPPQVVLGTVSVRVKEGAKVKATETVRL